MSSDTVRAVSRVVGRRATLRYRAVGVGASLLAACKGNDGTKGNSSGGAGGRSGTHDPSGTAGVAGKTLTAFVRGSWKSTTETTGGQTLSYSAAVDDGAWTLDFGGGRTQKGTWALQGGRLELRVPPSAQAATSGELADAAAANVAATVGDSVSLLLSWQPPGLSGTGDGQQFDVNCTRKSGVLRIRHMETSGGMTIHTCTRACWDSSCDAARRNP
ncbi:hypothetical protein AB0D71_18820 [Streptomyces avermitilis]|uniref:hypothetical protein n=1 Tax=Streptomyces avermitilis TaxID=33903 RepID=UPI0033D382EB